MKSLRWRLTLWFGISLLLVVTGLLLAAHWHLDYELRQEKWERTAPEHPDWVLHGSYSDKEVQDILGELVRFWVLVGVPLVGLALASAYFIARRSDRPVREVNRQLASLGADHFGRTGASTRRGSGSRRIGAACQRTARKIGIGVYTFAGIHHPGCSRAPDTSAIDAAAD